MTGAVAASAGPTADPSPAADTDVAGTAATGLEIDDHTWKDLEIFQAHGAGRSVHDLLCLTKTTGGSKVLKARMRRPFADANAIRRVQESIHYITAHRPVFDALPSEVVAQGVTEYLNGGLPVVGSMNPVAFAIEAATVRLGEFRVFARITQGVLRTAKMIRGLQPISDGETLPGSIPGELGPLIEEMRGLLGRGAFEGMPTLESWDLPSRTVFRLDRGFRSHEEDALRRLLRLVYQVDALVAMADATRNNRLVTPEILLGTARIEAEGLVNLFLSTPVPVDVELGRTRRLLFLTGPNMAGKSTFLRSVGVSLYLAHLGMGVPARRFRFTPFQCLITALNITDDIHGGVSFFRAEAIRMKAIADAIAGGVRVAALIDEPFKGTNIKDAMDASLLVLQAFARADDCVFAVSSHLIELGDTLDVTDRVLCCCFEASDLEDGLTFDYVLRPGVSSQRLGMRVLEQEGLVARLRSSTT